jgi:isochorismate synthase
MLNARAVACEARPVVGGGDLLSLAPDQGTLVFLECPARGQALLATGVALEIRAAGPERFATAARQWREVAGAMRAEPDAPPPIAIAGFAFEDDEPRSARWRAFGAMSLVVPRLAWVRRGARTWRIEVEPLGDVPVAAADGAVVAALPASSSPPRVAAAAGGAADRERWRDRVSGALDAISGGALRKVVLAREQTIALPPELDSRDVVRRLRDGRPSCATFWVRRGRQSFVGSSPELLSRVEGDRVEAVALAGTAAARYDRGDAAVLASLVACGKNAAEHAFVAGEIAGALRRICGELEVSERVVERLPEALHLATRFRGRLRRDLGALELAGLLHPTSAVCGLPRREARALITATEGERGWYAGGIGWIDATGDGELWVALRCGLLEPGRATVFAGAGIVAGSQPDAEYDETAMKMDAVLRLLDRAGDEDAAEAGAFARTAEGRDR